MLMGQSYIKMTLKGRDYELTRGQKDGSMLTPHPSATARCIMCPIHPRGNGPKDEHVASPPSSLEKAQPMQLTTTGAYVKDAMAHMTPYHKSSPQLHRFGTLPCCPTFSPMLYNPEVFLRHFDQLGYEFWQPNAGFVTLPKFSE